MSLRSNVFNAINLAINCKHQLASAKLNLFPVPYQPTVGIIYTVAKNNQYINIGENVTLEIKVKQLENALNNIKLCNEQLYQKTLETDVSDIVEFEF